MTPRPWTWPLFTLPRETWVLPVGKGAFGAKRKHDVHTGVDLYCPNGTPVQALTVGRVIKVVDFTGKKAGSPWWEDTQAVLVDSFDNGVRFGSILYGEMTVDPWVIPGALVKYGGRIGRVKRVLKKDKGKPTAMLHVELYTPGFVGDPVEWLLGKRKPRVLLDPTPELRRILEGK